MKVSVYITSYNQQAYLIEAVESVLAQTLRPHEIIVVDDCSSDGSQDVIRGYCSQYPDLIKPIFHTRNMGVVHTRNDALHAATGDYITYLDGDDRYLPTKLEKEAELLQQHPNAKVAYSNYYIISETGERIGQWADKETLPSGDIFPEVFSRRFPDNRMLAMEMVWTQAYQSVGYYDPSLTIWEDLDLRIRLFKQYQAVCTHELLAEYRTHRLGLSNSNVKQHYEALKYVYAKNSPLLDDMARSVRNQIDLRRRQLLAKMAFRVSKESSGLNAQGQMANRTDALLYYIKCLRLYPGYFNLSFLMRLMLPVGIYSKLRRAAHRHSPSND